MYFWPPLCPGSMMTHRHYVSLFVHNAMWNTESEMAREWVGDRWWWVGGWMDGWVNGTAASIFLLASYCCYLLRRQRHFSPLSFPPALFRFGICSIFVNISVPVHESSIWFFLLLVGYPCACGLGCWCFMVVVVVVVVDFRCGAQQQLVNIASSLACLRSLFYFHLSDQNPWFRLLLTATQKEI